MGVTMSDKIPAPGDAKLNKRGPSRRVVLGGMAASGIAAVGGLVSGETQAQSNKQAQVKSAEDMARDMAKARMELMEQDRKAKALREAKPYRDALDAQKKIFKQSGKNNPRYSEYQDALAKKLGITDWMSDEGRKILGYLNDWYNEN